MVSNPNFDETLKQIKDWFISKSNEVGKENALQIYEHSKEVEKFIYDLIIEVPLQENELFILQISSLFHDSGYLIKKRTPNFPVELTHIEDGKEFFLAALNSLNTSLSIDTLMIEEILNILHHHEDITFRYPFATLDGKKVEPHNSLGHNRNGFLLLSLFQSADSLTHAQLSNAQIAETEWLKAGLPFVSDYSDSLCTWQWHESIGGNLRLLAKRALVCAFTSKSFKYALDSYNNIENYLKVRCNEERTNYYPEVCAPKMRFDSLGRLSPTDASQLEIVQYLSWAELVDTLGLVSLDADSSILPYKNATKRLQILRLDSLSPMSLYAINRRIEENIELHDAMMIHLGFGLWDMPGLIFFRYKSNKQQKIAPPVVEIYEERDCGAPFNVCGLVDGLHRCLAARRLGLQEVRVISLAGVQVPLVPLPVKWKDVKEYEDIQNLDKGQKRKFRYNSLSDFPLEMSLIYKPNEQNIDYYFYRNLKDIGSHGKRSFDEYTV